MLRYPKQTRPRICKYGTRAKALSQNVTPSLPSAPQPVARMDTTRTDRALWPRAVMATLLFMILSLTVHLVDITWFDGTDQGAAVAEATLAHADPTPH